MKALGGMLAEAYASWSFSISECCSSLASSHSDEKPRQLGTPDSFGIVYQEPSFIPPPSAASFRPDTELSTLERVPKKRHNSGQGSFSVRKLLLRPSSSSSSSSSSRRPQISAPTNFRHIHSESFRFPGHRPTQVRPQPASLRPLELSIYMSDNRLSPILPHFGPPEPPVTPPQRVFTLSTRSEDSPRISHSRSYSSMSFHIPRRPVNDGSVFDSPQSDIGTPRRPQPAKLKDRSSPASSSPMMEDLVERVATAMLERDKLQEQIEDVIERQSIYISSRPSTAHGQPEMTPMPEIPALPPNAPSFSERLSSDRPRTALSQMSARTSYQANSSRKVESRIPPPPLPLRLRPPLRKKKSFSRVSTWLFSGGEPNKDISLDSTTNDRRPIADTDGFYEVVDFEENRRGSIDTLSTSSDWTVEEEQTLPTSLSPSSTTTLRARLETPMSIASGLRQPMVVPHRQSVGVAV
ncbi:uncharacterized protein F4812DRAFT_456726 [Daldinia caldariorum]|uniref:uncharacterized protein n=1 Tax=Daldinia caldariorum TaxID=326644 RepID=UPI002007CD4B|nr:uncharacterized protein F4812DRAFT_456726 [Daldinia caldariorum]KAI1470715.1 hypothetical protein F4812DRAFT_456726 [Daldinia caldariorum]